MKIPFYSAAMRTKAAEERREERERRQANADYMVERLARDTQESRDRERLLRIYYAAVARDEAQAAIEKAEDNEVLAERIANVIPVVAR